MSSAPVVHVDLGSFSADPYPELARMRAEAPICFVPELGATLLTRRDDIHACEKNVAVFSSHQPTGLMNELMGQNMMRRDGDDHRRERAVYYPAISRRAVNDVWAGRFAEITDGILRGLVSRNRGDLVTEYATAVSGEALKVLTGLTDVTHQQMDEWSQSMIDGIANYGGDRDIEQRCHAATRSIDRAIDDHLRSERDGDQSLLSIMVRSGMPLDNVRANIKLTISGGQNEPRDAIAGAIWALLVHPPQLDMVRNGTVPWRDAVEEYCRWIAPIGMSPRRIAEPHEYRGVRFEPGERVFLMFGSANRDELHFDRPEEFDITRDTRQALTFGAGPHFCAGAAASRSLIGDVALPKVFDRLDDLELDPHAGQVTFAGWAFRGPRRVDATWRSVSRPDS